MKPRRKPGRPTGHTLTGALLACAGVGGELEQTARRALRSLCLRHATIYDAAASLGVCERTLRRILAKHGTTFDHSIVDLRDTIMVPRSSSSPSP